MAGDDTNNKTPSIPDWQKQSQIPPPPAPSAEESETKDTSTADLDPLEHARRFLDDDSIKDAPREGKVAFLESKGLKPEQIEQLLEAQQPSDDDGIRTIHDSNTSIASPTTTPTPTPVPSPPSEPAQKVLSQPNPPPQQSSRPDAPPIITYPEFLLKPQKPPPLVTIDRLVTAGYIFAGLSALTYGASKYLVQPMLESLTDARHDLALQTQSSLSKLNTKLESSVSHVPYIPPLHKPNPTDSDSESIDEDPTELFHRDIATQTTPPISRRSSASSDSPPTTTIDSQATRLTSLHTSLQSLLSSTTTHFAADSLQTSMRSLQTTIDGLDSSQVYDAAYATPYAWSNNSSTNTTNKSGGAANEKDSQAVKFKAEIRALKGAFLSSRNFPTARAAQPFVMPTRS
jgi:hypothetical protein